MLSSSRQKQCNSSSSSSQKNSNGIIENNRISCFYNSINKMILLNKNYKLLMQLPFRHSMIQKIILKHSEQKRRQVIVDNFIHQLRCKTSYLRQKNRRHLLMILLYNKKNLINYFRRSNKSKNKYCQRYKISTRSLINYKFLNYINRYLLT